MVENGEANKINQNQHFNEESLKLIIDLLDKNYAKLKYKLSATSNYVEKTQILRELQLTEAELIRFRNAKPFHMELIVHQDNTSLDDFNI